MLIPCPHCGTRPVEEFTFLGDASVARPTTHDPASMEQWYDYVYLRSNPAGAHRELWYHEQGDRSWLVVTRNTVTHEVLKVEFARDLARAMGRSK